MNKKEFLSTSLPYELKMKDKLGVDIMIGLDLNEDLFHATTSEYDWYSISQFIPIVRHLSDLTKPIVQADYNDGNPFIPIVELAKIEKLSEPISFDIMDDFSRGIRGCCAKDRFDNQWLMYSYKSGFSLWHKPHDEKEHRPTLLDNQLQLFQQLIKWHFDLITDGSEVVYVTEDFNPYK